MISIELNKKLDKEVYKDFWNFSTSGVDFAGLIKRTHPLITIENSEIYIDKFYDENIAELQKSSDDLNIALKNKQTEFFSLLIELFKTDFVSNNCRGYISIFNCNPRFVETNEFQVFYKKSLEDQLAVVFHEVLHFTFFEYCDLKFPEQMNGLDKNSGKLWELSEIFNVIVLNLPKFQNIIGREERLFYPELSEKLLDASIIWHANNGDLNTFITKVLKYL